MKILVSGLLNIETTVSVRGFPIQYYPIDYPFFGVNSSVSGVGYNLAKALTVLGDSVSLFSFLGSDAEGERILAQLRREDLLTEHVFPTLKQTPVSAVLYAPDGKRQIYCDLKDIQEHALSTEQYRTELNGCGIAALCNINFNRAFIEDARRAGLVTATDVHVLGSVEDEYNRTFMENANILFLSDEALPCSAEDFIRRLYERYRNDIIVIGMGAQGALLFDAAVGESCLIPAYPCEKIVNTVGAGDALFSAFLHYYAAGMDAKSALQRAVVFAGVKIGYNGASNGFCTAETIERIMEGTLS